MKESRFIEKNEEHWKALEAFNGRLRVSGIRRLAAEEVREFARLLRLASHHLAYAKTHFPGGETLEYLNRVVGVAHNFFYVRERGSFSEIKEYFLRTFPRAVRESWRFWAVSTAFFLVGLLFAGLYVAADPARLQDVAPYGMFDAFQPGYTPDFGDGGVGWDYSLMTAVFITNNTAVAFNAFAWGLLAGLGTLYVLVYNGLLVGALFGFLHTSGADMLMAYSLILPHGVIELAAIFLSGGCGLMLGKGLLMPGEHSRRHSLVLHAKKAAALLPGVVLMLVAAALVEGFFTPLAIPPGYKLAFAALTGAGLAAYCLKAPA